MAHYPTYRKTDPIEKKLDALIASFNVAVAALDKIRDPRKRHSEPDKYTELGCVMNIADEALQTIEGIGFHIPEKTCQDKQEHGEIKVEVHKL